jgi:tetrahydromethanopterin S-methyltransferase subunit G
MTIQDLLKMPKGMKPDEWEAELKRRNKINNQLMKLSTERYDLLDAIDVLKDEIGSDRYNKKKSRLSEVEAKIEKLKASI